MRSERSAEAISSALSAALRVIEHRRAWAYWRYGPVSPSKEVMTLMSKV